MSKIPGALTYMSAPKRIAIIAAQNTVIGNALKLSQASFMILLLNAFSILAMVLFSQFAMANDIKFAEGPFSKMQMLLEKTIFNVDVLTVEVQLDRKTQSSLENLIGRQPYNDSLAEKAAQILISSQNMKIHLTFLRDINFNRFINEIKTSIQCAAESGAISKKEQDDSFQNLPKWFAPLQNAGIKNGDSLSYEISEDKLHIIFRHQDGMVVIDQTDTGASPRRILLSSYFAKCSDFRDGLIRSLIRSD